MLTSDSPVNLSALPGGVGGQNMGNSQSSTHKQHIDTSHTQSLNTTEVVTNRGVFNIQVPQGVYQLQMGQNGLEMRPVQGNMMAGSTTLISQTTHNVMPQQNTVAPPTQMTSQGISTMETAFGGAQPKTGQQYSVMNNMANNYTGAMVDGGMETRTKNQTQNTTAQQVLGRTEDVPTSARQTMDWGRQGIPSLNTLSQATDINQRVQGRNKELE